MLRNVQQICCLARSISSRCRVSTLSQDHLARRSRLLAGFFGSQKLNQVNKRKEPNGLGQLTSSQLANYPHNSVPWLPQFPFLEKTSEADIHTLHKQNKGAE